MIWEPKNFKGSEETRGKMANCIQWRVVKGSISLTQQGQCLVLVLIAGWHVTWMCLYGLMTLILLFWRTWPSSNFNGYRQPGMTTDATWSLAIVDVHKDCFGQKWQLWWKLLLWVLWVLRCWIISTDTYLAVVLSWNHGRGREFYLKSRVGSRFSSFCWLISAKPQSKQSVRLRQFLA